MAAAGQIRPATPADAEQVARLFRLVRDTCLPYLPRLYSPAEDLVFFRDHVLRSDTVWVAGEPQILGFCAWRQGWVDHLYVHPQHHGQGLGTALLQRAMTGQGSVRLWAFQRNHAALRFYAARGFHVVERTDGSRNEEREPDVLLAWRPGGTLERSGGRPEQA